MNSTTRPWYCHEAVHGVVKRHTNVDGTVIYFTQETPCDCAPPTYVPQPPPSLAQPQQRMATSAAESRSMAAVRRRYRLPANGCRQRLTSKLRAAPNNNNKNTNSTAAAGTGMYSYYPPSPPQRCDRFARPLPPQHVVIPSCAAPRGAPLQQEPDINVVAPVVFPTGDPLSRPLSVPPMTMPSGLDYFTSQLLPTPGMPCREAQHDHYKSFGFAFCPECGAGLLPDGARPQYTWNTCPAPHVRTRNETGPSVPAPLNEAAPHASGITVLSISPQATPEMKFCLLCGAPITYFAPTTATTTADTVNANAAPSATTGNATLASLEALVVPPLGTTPPSTVLGVSQPVVSVVPPMPLMPVPMPVPATPPPAPPLGMETPNQPSAPPPDYAATTRPPPPDPAQPLRLTPTPPPAVPPPPVPGAEATQTDWLTRRDMQSVDAVLASMLKKAAAGGGHLCGEGTCGLPDCPLCLKQETTTTTARRGMVPLDGRSGDKSWWCGSPAVMIVHNHYYNGH